MTTGIFQGVPLSMQRDGWWLDAPKTGSSDQRQRQHKRDWIKAGVLVALIACADLLVWDVAPGISLALLAVLSVLAGLAVGWPRLAPRVRGAVAVGSTASVLPLVELVQPLSVLIALCGLSACCAALAGLGRRDLMRGALRVWWVGPALSMTSGVTGVRQLGDFKAGQIDARMLVLGWALPIGATALFAVLLIGANPVLDRALSQLATWQPPTPDIWRLWFWAVAAAAIWPVLAAWSMRERLRARPAVRATVRRQGIVNAESVARSLVAFNALFALQTVMDILFLYGSAGLPDGISAATYAHRGAYPLLVTALLAGAFAVLARPHLAGRPAVRWLMLLWLVQTLALVGASVWRLDTYVDIYGLTRLRLAAYVWMGLVACGLCIVWVQIWRDRPAAWMMLRSGALGAVTLYACAFVNFDGVIADHNLTQPVQKDVFALCTLSEGALPAMERYWGADPVSRCRAQYYDYPQLFVPGDWREWGFRNWRVRRSLAAMSSTATQP